MNYKLLFPTYRARWAYLHATLRQYFGTQRAPRLLHLGSGEGDLDPVIAEFADVVESCDINAVDVAHATALNAGLRNVNYSVQDGEQLRFSDESFDAVVCYEVIEHVNDAQRLVAEMSRVLVPGGLLLLTCPNHDFPATYDPLNLLLRRVASPLPVGAYAYGHAWLPTDEQVQAWLKPHFDLQRRDALSFHLAGLIEAYVPGLLQAALKKNARNAASGAQSAQGFKVSAATGEPPFAGLVDRVVALDEALFSQRGPSVGLAYVAKKRGAGAA